MNSKLSNSVFKIFTPGYLIYKFLLISAFFSFSFFLNAKSQENIVEYAEVAKAYQLIFSYPDSAIVALNDLESRSKDQLDSIYGIVLNNTGIYYAVKNDADMAIEYFERALRSMPDNPLQRVRTLSNITSLYVSQKKFDRALESLYRAEEIADLVMIPDIYGLVYGEYASLYTTMQLYDHAIDYLLQGLSYYERNAERNAGLIAVEKQKLGYLYFVNDKYDLAKQNYLDALEVLKNSEQRNTYLLTLAHLGDLHISMGVLDSAAFVLDLAKEILEFDNPIWNTFLWELLGKMHSEKGDWFLAKGFFLKAYTEARSNGLSRYVHTTAKMLDYAVNNEDWRFIDSLYMDFQSTAFKDAFTQSSLSSKRDFYKVMMDYYAFKKNFLLAYEFSLGYQEVSDSLLSQRNTYRFNVLQNKYESHQLEHQNRVLQSNARNSKVYNFLKLLTALLFFVSLLFVWSYFKFRNEAREKEEVQCQQINELIAADLDKAKTIIALKDQFIETKEKELIEYASRINQMNEEIKEFEKLVSEVKDPKLIQGIDRIKTYSSENFHLALDKFRALNPRLLVNLSKPEFELTKSEIELCLMLRMRLINKEIARTLNITSASLATKKYRMLKKLSVDSDQGLDEWLDIQASE